MYPSHPVPEEKLLSSLTNINGSITAESRRRMSHHAATMSLALFGEHYEYLRCQSFHQRMSNPQLLATPNGFVLTTRSYHDFASTWGTHMFHERKAVSSSSWWYSLLEQLAAKTENTNWSRWVIELGAQRLACVVHISRQVCHKT